MNSSMLRVVLLGDHVLLRAGLRAAIDNEADMHVVADTDSVADAQYFIDRYHPDVVLVDAESKAQPALQAVRSLVDGRASLRVIMLGLRARDEDLLAALTAGASGYLTKDISPGALINALRGIRQGQAAISRTLMMTVIEALHDFADYTATVPEDPRLQELSGREREVLELITDGVSNRDIANRLVLSEHTVKNHVKAVLAKLEVPSRTAAAAIMRPVTRQSAQLPMAAVAGRVAPFSRRPPMLARQAS